MNKKRISDRKSQLRLDMQDFCLSLPQNSDPIAGYLLSILQWQASLDIETNSILHRTFVNEIDQLKYKLKMELKHTKNKQQQSEVHNNNITKYINDFHKLKQVFSYCLILSKKKSQLCQQLQKFNQYEPVSINLTEKLQNYLNQPIIFQTIFHSYLRSYNVNILTADLINFLYANHQSNIKTKQQQQEEIIKKWYNSDIQLLKNKSIMFKQLTDINKKYIQLQNKLQSSYIYYLCNNSVQGNVNQKVEGEQVKDQQQIIIKQKVKKLTNILNKIKNHTGLYNIQKQTIVIQSTQPLCSLRALEVTGDFEGSKIIGANKRFLLQILYNKSQSSRKIGDEQFTFMREKIIKVEALFYLNRILSAINVISYIYNQLDLEIRQNYQFQFKNIRKLIGSQFINKQTYQYKPSQKFNKNIFYSIDNNVKAFVVVDVQNRKVLYPSAINYFFSFIKSLLLISFDSKQIILQLLQVKSQYLQSLAETIVNIYQLIKVKQISCYKLLREYMQIILKSSCLNQLGNYQNSYNLIKVVCKQKQKIGLISQIIYEFDHNYSIKQSLQELVKIQFDGLTKNCINMFDLYNSILSEIIQIRNGLKFDHYYSVNQIHQKFTLLPTEIQKQHQDKHNSKIQHLYFEDIIHQICKASQTILYLPKLFFFFDLQLKLKRVVFKLQLCWSCKKQSVFDKKSQAFKDFLNHYCTPIFNIINQCHSVINILQKMQELQRYVEIFSQEVSRFHVIQKLITLMSKQKQQLNGTSFRQQLNKLSLDDLSQLNRTLHIFNPVQFQKYPSRSKLLQNLSKSIQKYNSIRLTQLPTYNPVNQKQRQNLASIIYLLQLIQTRPTSKQHQTLITLYHHKNFSNDIFHLKIYEQINEKYKQWLSCKHIDELIQFNEELLVISILKTLRQMQKQGLKRQGSQDYKKLVKFMKRFQISDIFINLNRIQQIQFWRKQFGIMTKYHQIYQLMFHFDSFNTRIYGNLGKRLQYKDRKILTQQNHIQDYSCCRSNFITKLYYIFQLKPLTRQLLQKNIQKIQQQILQTDSLHRSIRHYHQKLKIKVYQIFCEQIYKMAKQAQIHDQLGINFDGKKPPIYYIDQLRKSMLKAVTEHKRGVSATVYKNFKQIQMFREKKGYELEIVEQNDTRQYKIGPKKRLQRGKKAIISPQKIQQQKVRSLQDLRRKFKIQILKKSIHLRKQISKLEISQNNIRQEIIWQTSKLQHSVIQKINQFIALSNVDQQQSYINFRHTVNLETIKGIQNVIEQQTQMYMDKKNKALQNENGQAFLTEITEKQQQELGQKVDRSTKLLDSNVDCMVAHMRKIKIFAAWKKTMKKTNLTQNEWCNFNMNVQNILNNDKIRHSTEQIQNARNSYLKQNVTCQIMKEENSKINEKIQQLKMNNLQKKVKNYRQRLLKQ